jgi:hypothetical protein
LESEPTGFKFLLNQYQKIKLIQKIKLNERYSLTRLLVFNKISPLSLK